MSNLRRMDKLDEFYSWIRKPEKSDQILAYNLEVREEALTMITHLMKC